MHNNVCDVVMNVCLFNFTLFILGILCNQCKNLIDNQAGQVKIKFMLQTIISHHSSVVLIPLPGTIFEMQMVEGLLSAHGSDGWGLVTSYMHTVNGLLSVQGLVCGLLLLLTSVMHIVDGLLSVHGLRCWLLLLTSVMHMVDGLLSLHGLF